MKTAISILAIAAVAGTASAAVDGSNIPADAMSGGLPLLAVQDSATGFGNAPGGGQDSAGGSELNAVWGTIDGGVLKMSVTGNLEGNFNKMWIFFDGVAGGLNNIPVRPDGDPDRLNDGGFGEINNLGVTFDAGFEADHGMRLEIGGGFAGIRAFDLLDNTAGDVWTNGGPGDLPIVGGVGGFGTTIGWDNSNAAGVDDVSAADALTATSGWEFEIDLATFFGSGVSEVKASIFITNGGGDFFSNQILGGIAGANAGGSPDFSAIGGDQFVTIVPTPASAALLGLGALAGVRRRR